MYLYTEMNHKLDHWDKRNNRAWCPVGQWAFRNERWVRCDHTYSILCLVFMKAKKEKYFVVRKQKRNKRKIEREAAQGTQRKKLCQFSVLLSKIKYWLWRRKEPMLGAMKHMEHINLYLFWQPWNKLCLFFVCFVYFLLYVCIYRSDMMKHNKKNDTHMLD